MFIQIGFYFNFTSHLLNETLKDIFKIYYNTLDKKNNFLKHCSDILNFYCNTNYVNKFK